MILITTPIGWCSGSADRMSELEVETSIERMVSARWNKASRGELYMVPASRL